MQFLAAYSAEEVVALTGLTLQTFAIIWRKYCGPSTPIKRPQQLFWLFQYYKLYPISRGFRVIHGGRVNRRTFIRNIHNWQVVSITSDDIVLYRCIEAYRFYALYRCSAISCVSYR